MNSNNVYYYLFFGISVISPTCASSCVLCTKPAHAKMRAQVLGLGQKYRRYRTGLEIIEKSAPHAARGHGHAGLRPRPTATPTPAHDCTINVTINVTIK